MTSVTFDPAHQVAIEAFGQQVDDCMMKQFGVKLTDLLNNFKFLAPGNSKIIEGFTQGFTPIKVALSLGNELKLAFSRHMNGPDEAASYNWYVAALMEFAYHHGWNNEENGISLPLEGDRMCLCVDKNTNGEWAFRGYMNSAPDKAFVRLHIQDTVLAIGQWCAHEKSIKTDNKVLEQANHI
jgi:hypothetical protein